MPYIWLFLNNSSLFPERDCCSPEGLDMERLYTNLNQNVRAVVYWCLHMNGLNISVQGGTSPQDPTCDHVCMHQMNNPSGCIMGIINRSNKIYQYRQNAQTRSITPCWFDEQFPSSWRRTVVVITPSGWWVLTWFNNNEWLGLSAVITQRLSPRRNGREWGGWL